MRNFQSHWNPLLLEKEKEEEARKFFMKYN